MIDVDCMQRCVLSNHLYILVACIYTTQRGLNVYVIIQKSLNKPSYGAVLRKCRLQEYISGLKEHSAACNPHRSCRFLHRSAAANR